MGYKKQITGAALGVLAGAFSLAIAAMPAAARPAGAAASDDQASAQRGKQIFVSNCSFCHGATARGGEGGPDLLREALVLDDVNGNKIGPVVLNGLPGGMPKFALTPAQISDIASFLHRAIDAAADRDTYQTLNIVVGDPKAGETYFNGAGKCNTCHSVTGDLRGIGARYDPVDLQDMLVMPKRHGRRRDHAEMADLRTARTVTVTMASGQSFAGVLEHIDDFNVALRDANGEYHSFARNGDVPAVEVRDPLQGHYDLLTKYTDADMHNLTAYLVSLK